MEAGFRPTRIRGTGAVLLDVVFAMLVMATLVIAVLTLLDNAAQDRLARAYARQFRVTQEAACPAVFGKSFWFSCASEARAAGLASATRGSKTSR